jgi:malonate-semialdehyde dehydrogenase (acetylating)/methylmalonate-semialdehyde dehydrogenase
MIAPEAQSHQEKLRNYVYGEWVDTNGDDGQEVLNPATGDTLGTVPFSDSNDVDATVERAQEAFEDWQTRSVEQRIQPLFRFKTLLEEHQEELAEQLVEEHGKTRGEAMGELRRGIENVEVACGIPSMMQAGNLSHAAPQIDESANRESLGVFTAITPFNFPGMIPLWFLPYAVATGNSFILKPSEQAPLTAQFLFKLIDEAGFPDGVVNLVHGSVDTVNTLLKHPGIAGVSFVGSTPVAEHIYETASAHGKRVQAQGGAKNHAVVTENADIEYAAKKIFSAACACSGERCLALDIAVVEEKVYDGFTEAVVEQAESAVVGHGLDDETTIGPLITSEHEQNVQNAIQTGIEEGAEVLYDGREVNVDGYDGNFLGPVVFGDVTTDMVIQQEEIFGPVLGLLSVSDFDEAIETVNSTRFGNAASLFTDSGHKANRFKHEVEAGNLGVNVGTVAPMAFFHFGGRKASFFGDLHAQAEDMVQFYTDKTIYIERWPNQ